MAAKAEETGSQIESVDVDVLGTEIDDKSKITCDSGLETLEACSTSLSNPSGELENQEDTSTKGLASALENSDSDTIQSPRSLTPEEGNNCDSVEKSDGLTPENACENDEIRSVSEKTIADNVSERQNPSITKVSMKTISISQDNVPVSILNDHSPEETSNPLTIISLTDNIVDNSLKMSTMSLNEDPTLTKTNQSTLHKAPFSKSAENITIRNEQETSTSQNDLNTQKILSDFSNQKTKVSATQKVLPDTPANLDVRYPRLPKEILNQDLGSIYKNVHGIFSSVSGSLKNAYNISHKVTVPKPVTKPVLNTKIINEIFEEYPASVLKENGVESTEINQEMPLKSPGCDTETDAKKDVCRLQVETLERLLAEQRKEMAVLRERVRQQADELQEKDETFKDLEGKMDQVRIDLPFL